jgi:hypothetical protein
MTAFLTAIGYLRKSLRVTKVSHVSHTSISDSYSCVIENVRGQELGKLFLNMYISVERSLAWRLGVGRGVVVGVSWGVAVRQRV